MKKRLVIMLIIVMLINMIAPNLIYADENTDNIVKNINEHINIEDVKEHEAEYGEDATDQVFTTGTADLTPDKSATRTEKIGESRTSSSTVASKLCGFLVTLPKTANSLMKLLIDYAEPNKSEYKGKYTIENLVFNRYKLFNIDFFDYNENSHNINEILKKNIAKWYFSLRNIAAVGSLIVLVYIGIRMVMSTIAEEQAKYKKMFISWLKSFILIFVMHYIVIFFLSIQDWILETIGSLVEGQGFEEFLLNNTDEAFANTRGWDAVAITIQYYVLVYFQIVFFLTYFKRFLKVGFLLVVAPLVTITYSVDIIGDGEAQAYNAWLKEIIFSIFLQALHAAVYAIFIFSAAEITKAAPIMGALLLMTLSRTEKIAKTTLKIGGKGIGDQKVLNRIKGFKKK